MDHEIPQLSAKIDFLLRRSAVARRVAEFGERKGLKGLCDLIKIPRKTIDQQIKNGKIRSDFEILIAKRFRFHEQKLAWTHWRKGTADEFKTAYEALHEPPSNTADTASRRRNIPLTPVYGKQQTRDGRLSSLRMRANSNSGLEWRIRIDLHCREVDGEAIRRGYIKLDCGEAIAPEEEANFRDLPESSEAKATLRWASTEDHPMWEVKARNGILDDVSPADHFCVVRNLAPGRKLTASFAVSIKDVSSSYGSFCKGDGTPLSGMAKKRLLDRIAKIALLQTEDGQAVLCSHEATFEDARPEDQGEGGDQ